MLNILQISYRDLFCFAAEKNHLRSLKFIISGGSVVKAKNYDFVYHKIKKDVIFTSTYGMYIMFCIFIQYNATVEVKNGLI